MLIDEIDRYDVDILAIQEMRWTGGGIIEKKNHTIFYSCKQKEHTVGVGFLVNHCLKHSIIDFNLISPRLCIIKMARVFFQLQSDKHPCSYGRQTG
jgi:hypothetical protein